MLNIKSMDVVEQGDGHYSVYLDNKDFETVSGYKVPEQFSETFVGRIELQGLNFPLDENDILSKAIGEAWDDVDGCNGYDTYTLALTLEDAMQIKEAIESQMAL